jgi:hypothetical protein
MSFRPSFSNSLLFTTILVIVVLLGMSGFFLVLNHQYRDRGGVHYMFLAGACVMILMVAGSFGFRIRYYEINSGNLIVKTGFSEKVFSLQGLESARVQERPFAGARKVAGMGGVWSYYGSFRSSSLGEFHAYAASTSSGVLLSWPDKKVLVTPEDSAGFIKAVRPSQ